MGMNLGGKCGMFFLITINLIFFLLGLGLLIVGILLKVDQKVVDTEEVVEALNEVEFNGSLKFGNVAQSIPILLIVVGVFVFLIAGLGMFGACCKNKCMLVLYGIVVLLIFIFQVVVIVLVFIMKDKIENAAKDGLQKSFDKYEGVASTATVSKGWDLIFVGFECCGIDPVHATSNLNEFSTTQWWPNRGSDYVPYSCCKEATEDNYKTGTDVACQQGTLVNMHTQGCYVAVKDHIMKYQNAAIGLGIALLIIELIGFVFAFVLCRAISKSDDIV